MKSFVRSLGAFLAAALLLTAGCFTSSSTPPLAEDYTDAYYQVHQWVPTGASLHDAQKTMEAHGFTCSMTRDAQWQNQSHVDYLYCDQIWSAPNSGLVMKRRWQVALFLINDKVSGQYLATGLVGR
jgi:hypothetical protein